MHYRTLQPITGKYWNWPGKNKDYEVYSIFGKKFRKRVLTIFARAYIIKTIKIVCAILNKEVVRCLR